MPKLPDAARVSPAGGAEWKNCDGCGLLFPAEPGRRTCGACDGSDGEYAGNDVPTGPRCSCGRPPLQWLDGPRGPGTVPYCGRPVSNPDGLQRGVATCGSSTASGGGGW